MKVKCNNCNDILTDEIHAYQICSCGKVSFDTYDTSPTKLYRILGNKEDVTVIDGEV